MSAVATGNVLPVASGARHRKRLGALGALASVAVLVLAVSAVEIYSTRHADDAPTSFVAQDRTTATASRSAASLDSGSIPVTNGRGELPLALVAGSPMFPLSASGVLASWEVGAPVEAHELKVQSVVASGFWLGFDGAQRVFVTVPNSAVEKGSLSLDRLQAGQTVNVSGRVAELPDNLGSLGLEQPIRVQLQTQGKLIEANNIRLPS